MVKTAFAWLRDGIPKKRATVKVQVQDLFLKDVARKIKSKTEAGILLEDRVKSWHCACRTSIQATAIDTFGKLLPDLRAAGE